MPIELTYAFYVLRLSNGWRFVQNYLHPCALLSVRNIHIALRTQWTDKTCEWYFFNYTMFRLCFRTIGISGCCKSSVVTWLSPTALHYTMIASIPSPFTPSQKNFKRSVDFTSPAVCTPASWSTKFEIRQVTTTTGDSHTTPRWLKWNFTNSYIFGKLKMKSAD